MSYALGQTPTTTSPSRAAGVPGPTELLVQGLARDTPANTYFSFAEAMDAMAIAARRYGGRQIQLVSPPGSGRVVADLEVGSGRPRVLHGMGDTLTDWACESATFAQNWHGRLNDALNTATVASVIGAGAGGLLGALLKKPILGLGVGAVTGWAAAAIWTAPLRP